LYSLNTYNTPTTLQDPEPGLKFLKNENILQNYSYSDSGTMVKSNKSLSTMSKESDTDNAIAAVDVYETHKNLLQRITDEVKIEQNKPRPAILPRSRHVKVIQAIHDTRHYDVDQTMALVRMDCNFKKLRHIVEAVVSKCYDCRLSAKMRESQTELLNTIKKENAPFDTYHVDLLGPLRSTKKLQEHVFMVVDDFSSFVWLYSLTWKDASDAVKHLKKQSVNYGNPRIIISHAAVPFLMRSFTDYCNNEGIHHVFSTNEMPWTTDQVEKLKGMLVLLLKMLCPETPRHWGPYLNLVQMYLNASPATNSDISPFQLLFGTRIRMIDDLRVWHVLENWTSIFQGADQQQQPQKKGEKLRRTKVIGGHYNKRRILWRLIERKPASNRSSSQDSLDRSE
jgi:hypothetical protein